MEVSDPNNVKIYNLSAGKSLPEWLSDRKRRALQKKDVDLQRRIELIQDFDMPGVSTNVKMSPDGQFILATGIYKPRVKCYDVNNLSIKFERCFDSEVINFEILSEDYSKLVFLQCDRYVEFHSAPGRYYRLRIPKFGRDLQYHYPTCDLYVVGVGSDIYRLNLERGQFLTSLVSESNEINKCTLSPVHQMLVVGTKEGKVEAWDPRTRNRIGILDCAFDCVPSGKLNTFPSVTALSFQNAMTMGVGTATGQIALYDIRANKPFFVKDHLYELPIKNIEFDSGQNLVLSMDSSVLKIWHKNDGKIFTSIEGKSDYNDLCFVKNSGMLFIANESVKIQTYYIPGLGAAPKWCGFLDSLTEELEENKFNTIYDDYKFITKNELEDLGLSHLLGSNLLRAYMHGYFIDIRLYKKAKSLSDPFAFDQYKKKKIREKIDEDRSNRVKLKKLPAVNKDLALKLMNDPKSNNTLLQDDRFGNLFNNPDFQIDVNAEEYRLINPVLSKFDKEMKKAKKVEAIQEQFEEVEGKPSSEESSSDDDQEFREEMKKQYKIIQKERKDKEAAERKEPKFYELRQGEEFKGISRMRHRVNKTLLGDRVKEQSRHSISVHAGGSREMKFSVKKPKDKKYLENLKKHKEERRKVGRSAEKLLEKGNFRLWKGKRVQ